MAVVSETYYPHEMQNQLTRTGSCLLNPNFFRQKSSQQVFVPECTEAPRTSSNHFFPGPGRQELYDGSGVFISKVEIQNIHIEAGKRPTEILNKLLGYFFDLKTLASQRNNLNDTIVHACTGMSL